MSNKTTHYVSPNQPIINIMSNRTFPWAWMRAQYCIWLSSAPTLLDYITMRFVWHDQDRNALQVHIKRGANRLPGGGVGDLIFGSSAHPQTHTLTTSAYSLWLNWYFW